ncbi:MAG: 2-keto-3-deoxygluconate transporter [Comamonas sp.]|jgi:2-keto-3-deoxygluconate permease|uniref:2-keto-3-deoxygluconate permease n=1 Tax=Comamonas avium TaxID=2762231 RepID=A0ABR8S992_9BURK|nr:MULTISPECIES: 2-keto-3-deoxygluconate transporter [Comamonas]MBD7960020.1 2-keto-3-deoxygluconate transporter [Comamonas avium]
MKIKRTIEKIPGGMMLVPLLLGAVLHTFWPGTGKYFGSFTNGLITGVVPILAVWLFCLGASIHIRATGTVLRKSGALIGAKVGMAWLVALVLSRWLPIEGIQSGFFVGLSVLAVVAALDMTNAGLYASLMEEYGSKEEAGAAVLIGMESGPLVTMIILGSTGLAVFEPQLLAGVIIPFLIGFTLGNLDEELREFFSKATRILIPFFAFSLGNTINLSVIVDTGLLGVLLGVAVMVVSGTALVVSDIVLGGGRGTAGIAASSTAGAAVATPHLVAQAAPQFAPSAPAATALVAACVVVTAILTPVVTTLWASRVAPRLQR